MDGGGKGERGKRRNEKRTKRRRKNVRKGRIGDGGERWKADTRINMGKERDVRD